MAEPKRAKPKRTTIVVTTANICHLPRRRWWQYYGRSVQAMRMNRYGAVIGQEIEDSSYAGAWHRAAAKSGRRTYGLGHECPVSVPHSWKAVDDAVVKSHEGLKWVSPERVMTSVKSKVSGIKVAVVACHTVSKPRRGVDHWEWRIAMHAEYRRDLHNLVTRLHSQGYTVFYGGDMNMDDLPTIVHGEVPVGHSGYDHLLCLPAEGVRIVKHRQKVAGASRLLGMDHPLVTAVTDLECAA